MLGSKRSRFAPVKRRMAAPFIRAGVPALAISVTGIPLSLLAACLLVRGQVALAVATGVTAAFTDFLDGEVARAQGRESPVGNYLEAICDRVVESVLLLALAQLYPIPAAFALTFSLLVSYAKPRVALVLVADNRDWPGWADHADRIILILLSMAFCLLPTSPGGFSLAQATLWTLAGLCFVGAAQRIHYGVRLIQAAERDGTLLPYLQNPKR